MLPLLAQSMWKQFVLTSKKALKKKQFHPENAGNGICKTLHFKIFPGEHVPGPPYDSATPLVGQTNARPPAPPPPPKKKKFWTRTPMISHGMIKFGRANSPTL